MYWKIVGILACGTFQKTFDRPYQVINCIDGIIDKLYGSFGKLMYIRAVKFGTESIFYVLFELHWIITTEFSAKFDCPIVDMCTCVFILDMFLLFYLNFFLIIYCNLIANTYSNTNARHKSDVNTISNCVVSNFRHLWVLYILNTSNTSRKKREWKNYNCARKNNRQKQLKCIHYLHILL